MERKHQHLLNVARSLYFQSHVPLAYWGECILTASYLINRIPSSIPQLHNQTHFQILFNKPPKYSHIRNFGCLCFVSTLERNRHKFSPRAFKCVFLGYPSGYKGYKVLDVTTNKILIIRDVVFHEHIFPFATQHSTPVPFPLYISFIPSSSPASAIDSSLIPAATSHPNPHSPITHPTTRSGKIVKPPSFLNDYIRASIHSTYQYHLHSFISHSNLSPTYSSFTASIIVVHEPSSYAQASVYSEWRAAMDTELHALQANGTWSLVPLPAGKTTIGSKWVYKVKFLSDGSVERYKARLVAQGFTQ